MKKKNEFQQDIKHQLDPLKTKSKFKRNNNIIIISLHGRKVEIIPIPIGKMKTVYYVVFHTCSAKGYLRYI